MQKPKANTRHAQSRQASEIDHKPAARAILNPATWVRMTIASPKSLVACLMFIVSLSVFVVRFRPAARASTGSGPEHVLSFAYYSIKDDWDSTLTLNNSSVIGLATTVTVYSLDGRALTLPTLDIKETATLRFPYASSSAEPRRLASFRREASTFALTATIRWRSLHS